MSLHFIEKVERLGSYGAFAKVRSIANALLDTTYIIGYTAGVTSSTQSLNS